MLEILDIPDLRNQMAPISIEKYHRMIESGIFDDWDVELLSGVLVRKMSKSELHIYLADLLADHLRSFCAGSNLWVRKEDPITIGDSEPEPDISVVEGNRSGYRHQKPVTALFVVEIAVTSYSIDLAKASDYAAAGIPEYWIVRPAERETRIFLDPRGGKYQSEKIVPGDAVATSTSLPDFQFELSRNLEE